MPRAMLAFPRKCYAEVMIELRSAITCPACGFQAQETMPEDACVFFYDCKGCGTQLKPKKGDCCVFCSYGSVKCPPIQADRGCCGADSPPAGGGG